MKSATQPSQERLSNEQPTLVKVILGVDNVEAYLPALGLVDRLKFPACDLTLAHSVEMYAFLPGNAFTGQMVYDYRAEGYELGNQFLDKATSHAEKHGFAPKTELLTGSPAYSLTNLADQNKADLVAVQAMPKRGAVDTFLNSITRSLLISAHQSILISKGAHGQGKIRAVFATDFSEYADRALDLLLKWAPKGLSHIHVVHAFDESMINAKDRTAAIPAFLELADAKVERLAKKIRDAGYHADGSVVSGFAPEVIPAAVNANEAELLILGAQGHGFVHRFFAGSTSLHQALNERYSVLVLRPEMPTAAE